MRPYPTQVERLSAWFGDRVPNMALGVVCGISVYGVSAVARDQPAGQTLIVMGLTLLTVATFVWACFAVAAYRDWFEGDTRDDRPTGVVWREPRDDWRVGE